MNTQHAAPHPKNREHVFLRLVAMTEGESLSGAASIEAATHTGCSSNCQLSTVIPLHLSISLAAASAHTHACVCVCSRSRACQQMQSMNASIKNMLTKKHACSLSVNSRCTDAADINSTYSSPLQNSSYCDQSADIHCPVASDAYSCV